MAASHLLLLLLCLVVVYADLTPTHVYLSLTGIPTQVQVTYTTTTKPTNAQVQYWLSSSTTKVAVSVTAADVTTFTRPVTSTVNYINTVTLTGLVNNQMYSYQIIGDTNNTSFNSKVFKFTHIPANGQAVSIGIYGDLGSYGYALTQTNANGLKAWVNAGKFDIILHNGDLAYNLATDNGAVGDKFMDNIEPISSALPYIVTPGNHEFMVHDEPYYKNFWAGQTLLAKNSKSTAGPMWFSFDIGNAHIVGVSTEVYCEDTGNIQKQWEWLDADLKAASSRTEKPWIFVFGHRPLYSGISSNLHSRLMRLGLQCTNATLDNCNPLKPCDSGKDCGYSIQELLIKYKVDMFNAGHEHLYMRNNPINGNLHYEDHPKENEYINPDSPLHIISGAAGVEHEPPASKRGHGLGATPHVLTNDGHSFSTLVVHNSSAYHYYQVNAADGTIIDNFWVWRTKDKPAYKSVAFTLDTNTATECNQ